MDIEKMTEAARLTFPEMRDPDSGSLPSVDSFDWYRQPARALRLDINEFV